MRLYRISFADAQGMHMGYAFAGNLKAAAKARVDFLDNCPDGKAEIEPIEVTRTRSGIIAALNQYADHPNNG